jgi:hypothetical protein
MAVLALVWGLVGCPADVNGPSDGTYDVFTDVLASGFEFGVNTSDSNTDWLTAVKGAMRATYPSGESWGVVFIAVEGDPQESECVGRDFLGYSTLEVQLRGDRGSEIVDVGIKDCDDPDDGSEKKIPIICKSDWDTIPIPLSEFTDADLGRLRVVCEFVFRGTEAKTVYFRNVRYVK